MPTTKTTTTDFISRVGNYRVLRLLAPDGRILSERPIEFTGHMLRAPAPLAEKLRDASDYGRAFVAADDELAHRWAKSIPGVGAALSAIRTAARGTPTKAGGEIESKGTPNPPSVIPLGTALAEIGHAAPDDLDNELKHHLALLERYAPALADNGIGTLQRLRAAIDAGNADAPWFKPVKGIGAKSAASIAEAVAALT